MRLGTVVVVLGMMLVSSEALAQSHKVVEARAAVAADRKDATASFTLGRVLRRAGIHQAALQELQRGMLLPGARTGPLAIEMRYELARVHLDQGRFNEARRACDALKHVAGGRGMAHACMAEAHMLRKRASDALPEVDQALKHSPGLYEARVVEGYARWLNGQESEAETTLRNATRDQPKRIEAWLALGRLQSFLNKPAEALQSFEAAHAVDPDDAVAAYALASVLPSEARAVSLLEGAIRSRPTYGPAHARLGEVLMDLGRFEQAEQEIRLALRSGEEADWHALLAEVLVRRGQYDQALSSAAHALRRVPNHARGKLAEADALAGKRDIDLAIDSYQAAFGFGRTNPTALVRGARASLEQARETTARGLAERAVASFPKWAPAWEVLGDIEAKSGKNKNAIRAYENALRSDGPIDRSRIQNALRALKQVQ